MTDWQILWLKFCEIWMYLKWDRVHAGFVCILLNICLACSNAQKAIRICRQLWFRSYLDLLQSKADCIPVSEMVQRFHLRSAAGHQLVVPLYRLNLWPSGVLCTRSKTGTLPRLLRDTSHNTTSFGHSLKTFFLSEY